jgi:hypothetical protein
VTKAFTFVALVAATITLSVVTAGNAARVETLDLVMGPTSSVHVDVGDKGYSRGDYFPGRGPLRAKVGGKRVGSLAGIWTIVSPAGDDVSLILHLPKGNLHVDGRINHSAKPSVLRVVAGTGQYAGARGKATFSYLSETLGALHVELA